MSPADLHAWRLQQQVSQEHLAALLGVHGITVSRWERGAVSIPPFLDLALAYLRDEPDLSWRQAS